jgi:hypothetical protein
MRIRAVIIAVSALALSLPLAASGPLGIYGIVERVVFEPDEARAERVQVWGAFALVEGGESGLGTAKAAPGYLYLQLPPRAPESEATRIRREWADLEAIAGTGQAVGFGSWWGSNESGLRVRRASERPTSPAIYRTDSGVVKLSATGERAALVKELQDALRK